MSTCHHGWEGSYKGCRCKKCGQTQSHVFGETESREDIESYSSPTTVSITTYHTCKYCGYEETISSEGGHQR